MTLGRRFILGLLLILLVVGGLGLWGYKSLVVSGPLSVERILIVPFGISVSALSKKLQSEGIVHHSFVFEWATRTIGLGKVLHAGEYQIPARANALEVLSIIHLGKTVIRRITIPEGLYVMEVRRLLMRAGGLRGSITERIKEGELLPETYHYSYGDTRNDLIRRMKKAMHKTLKELWLNRKTDLPIKNPVEVLTMASIVEKETGLKDEKARVAGVFYNRLRKGMRLQSDPTVIYGLTNGRKPLGRKLTRIDLGYRSPYNTYLNNGLPPGPIANPGKGSIRAALNPATTSDLYFVADGEGGHVFSKTLKEHNINVKKWRSFNKK